MRFASRRAPASCPEIQRAHCSRAAESSASTSASSSPVRFGLRNGAAGRQLAAASPSLNAWGARPPSW